MMLSEEVAGDTGVRLGRYGFRGGDRDVEGLCVTRGAGLSHGVFTQIATMVEKTGLIGGPLGLQRVVPPLAVAGNAAGQEVRIIGVLGLSGVTGHADHCHGLSTAQILLGLRPVIGKK